MGSQQAKSKQELGGRNQSRDHRGTLLTDLLFIACFLKHFRAICQGIVTSTVYWDIAHDLEMKKITHSHLHRPICRWWLIRWDFLFPGNSSVSQVDKNVTCLCNLFHFSNHFRSSLISEAINLWWVHYLCYTLLICTGCILVQTQYWSSWYA